MTFGQKTRAAALGALVALLLAGCAGSPTAGQQASQDGVPSSSRPADTTGLLARKVKALKVTNPLTIVVTPFNREDSGYGKDFTVHVTDIATPAKGECGYDEAFSLAKDTLIGHVWFLKYTDVKKGVNIDDHRDRHGFLDSFGLSYGDTMIDKGMAYVPPGGPIQWNVDRQKNKQTAGVGLWTTCPGFGAKR